MRKLFAQLFGIINDEDLPEGIRKFSKCTSLHSVQVLFSQKKPQMDAFAYFPIFLFLKKFINLLPNSVKAVSSSGGSNEPHYYKVVTI